MAGKPTEDVSISGLKSAVDELKDAVTHVRDLHKSWNMPPALAPLINQSIDWNFNTFEKYINQRFVDLSMQLRERYEAQQTGVTAALAAAEKAVNAALIAAEKAVDKAERAQELRNQVANEFRDSLSDLSGLMWTSKEGQSTVDSVRRELGAAMDNIDKKVAALSANRIEATESLRKALENRIGALEVLPKLDPADINRKISTLENANANMQGRIWAVSALWAIIGFGVSIGIRFIGH